MGFPNANAYPIQKKGLKRKDIGNLSTYILPVRIGSIKKQFRQLNFLSVFLQNYGCTYLYFLSQLKSVDLLFIKNECLSISSDI